MHLRKTAVAAFFSSVFLLPISAQVVSASQDPYGIGKVDGTPDGDREGRERGALDGQTEGRNSGYNEGFSRCEAVERRTAYERGYNNGTWQGRSDGDYRGRQDGATRGAQDGETQGYADGVRRAGADAENAASGPGRAEGHAQAERSDAREKGRTVGLSNGDRDANAKAKSVEVERGRKDYRAERYNEPSNLIEFAQKAGLNQPSAMRTEAEVERENRISNVANPDYRYKFFKRSYPTPAENTLYQNGYIAGYNSGFRLIYTKIYDTYYNDYYRIGDLDGCQAARNRSYAADERRGYDDGYRTAYQSAYDSSYQIEYKSAYNRVFPGASSRGYQQNYDRLYKEHFESARSAAYKRRYDELYNDSYQAAYKQKYEQMYPVYAAQFYKQGRDLEAKEFKDRPLRLTKIEITDRNNDGVFKKEEVLRIKFIVRNFAETAVNAQSIKIQLDSTNPHILLLKPWENLAKSLPVKTVAIVKEGLGFQVNNGAIGNHSIRFSLLKDGVVMEQRTIDFTISP